MAMQAPRVPGTTIVCIPSGVRRPEPPESIAPKDIAMTLPVTVDPRYHEAVIFISTLY